MDLSTFKKAIAGISVSALVLTQAGITLAYNDVPAGIWYEEAVDDFVAAGYLDSGQSRFRGGDPALRAEFTKLVVELNGGILGTAPSVPSFSDVPVGAWYYGYMEEAAAEGWVRGDGNCYGSSPCYARPGAMINRAEAAALIVRSFGLVGTSGAPQFVDNPSGQWYTDTIQTAADNCVLQGDDGRGTVRPGDNMNRAEMVVMLHRVDLGMQYPDCGAGTPVSGPAGIDSINTLSVSTIEVEFTTSLDRAAAEDLANYDIEGLTVDSASLTSADVVEITFEEAMVPGDSYTLFVSGMTAGGEEFDDAITFTGHTSIPTSAGTLEVSLNPNTPLGDTIPRGAIGIAMLSADFTASCSDDIQVEGLTLIHEGQGSQADISSSWMSVNGARVSRTRVFDSEDQTADIRFSRPLLIEACETVTVDFMADFLSTAAINGRHNYVIELASDILSNAQQVSGTFPVRGETFELAAVTSGIVTVTYRSVTPTQIDVNDTDAVVGKWEFSVNSTEDQTFYSVTLENTGTASDGDFVNIYVQRTDGTPLTDTVAQTVADYITLTFDPPFTVLEGDKITLEVVADIVDGAADTVTFSFEETNDVFAVGSLYGYGVNGQLYGSQVTTSGTATTVTINAGELTIDIDGPVTEEYTPDADDIVMANVDFITGGEDINVNEMYAMILGQTSSGGTLVCKGSAADAINENVEDVEVRNTVTGQTVDGVRLGDDAGTKTGTTCTSTSTTTSTTAIYRFDDFVLRDSSRWELRMDFIADVPANGHRFRAYVCSADENDTTGCNMGGYVTASTQYNFDAEGLSTGDKVTDIRPGEDVAGNFMEVATAIISLTERSIGSTDTVVENSQDITLFRFEATAGKAEDIFLTQLVIKADSGSLVDGTDYTLWVDSDDDGTVDTILESGRGCEGTCNGAVQTSGATDNVPFDDLAGGGYTIPAEETVMFEVHADIAGSLNRNELSIGFNDTSGQTYIEAEEADDGTALTTIGTSGCTGTTQICVSTTTSKIFNLRNQGSLFVTQDSVPTRSRQLLAGELGEAILRLEMRAEDEPIDVTRFIFTNSGATAYAGINNDINRLKLYREGESTSFASATVDNCNNISSDIRSNSFCAVMESQQLVIPEGERVDILVRPDMQSDEAGAVQTNTGSIRLVLYAITDSREEGSDNTTSGTGSITARGFESSNVLKVTDGDTTQEGELFMGSTTPVAADTPIVGNSNDVVLAKIVSIEDVNPDADGTNVPQGTNKRLAEFKFTSSTNSNTLGGRNKATLSGIVFQISATNVMFDASEFDMYNKNDQTQQISCTAYNSTPGNSLNGSDAPGTTRTINAGIGSGTMLVDCRRATNTSVDLDMDSGDSITLVLEGDITDNQVGSSAGSSVSVSLTNFSQMPSDGESSSATDSTYSTYGVRYNSTGTFIHWSDSLNDSTVYMFKWIEYGQTQISSTSYSI